MSRFKIIGNKMITVRVLRTTGVFSEVSTNAKGTASTITIAVLIAASLRVRSTDRKKKGLANST